MLRRIAQITDTHLFAREDARIKGFPSAAGLARVLSRVAAAAPEHVIATGDISQDESVAAYHLFWRLCRHYLPGIPVSVVPGNHDDPDAMAGAWGDGGDAPSRPPWIDLGRWRLVHLDTRVPGAVGGRVGKAGRDRIVAAAKETDRWLLIALHHPPLPTGTAWIDPLLLADGDELLAQVRDLPTVRAMICGHIHQDRRFPVPGIYLAATPSTCHQFAPTADVFALDQRLPGLRILELGDSGEVDARLERVHPRLDRVISGGQTGVDRAALDVAMGLGLAVGGWCPAGRRAEDGVIPAHYPLRETPSEDYAERTAWNVRDSDATLVLHNGEPSGGTRLTVERARQAGRPCYTVGLDETPNVEAFDAWLAEHGVRQLNVAGPRGSSRAEVATRARSQLRALLTLVPDAARAD